MRRRQTLLACVAVAAGLLVGVTVAQATIQQYFRSIVSPAKAGKPVSLQVKQQTSLSADEPGYKVAGQPPPQQAQTIRVNKGFQFNGKYFKRCKLAALQANGPAGCPSASKIGTGIGAGSAKPILTKVDAKLTLFNGEKQGGKDTVYVFTLPTVGPTFVVVGTINKVNKGSYGYELRFKIDPIKTLPNAPDAAIVQVRTNTPVKSVKKSGKKRYLIVAPKTCKGKWSFEGEVKFEDGRTVKVPGTQTCKKK
jgi:hypothetical protein